MVVARHVSIEEEISQLRVKAPHVVLMGAGASVATCPNGDRNGRRLPVMSNLVKTVGLRDLIPESMRRRNFETIYSSIASDPSEKRRAQEMETRIYDYFDDLGLPDHPTIYDHLLLALQPKDIIASFNWDPFLIQAIRRNERVLARVGCPVVLFLHGNVLEGRCEQDHVIGTKGAGCPQCGKGLVPSRLLYPVTQKDYASDVFLKDSWRRLEHAFKHAFMVTIFGYSAPRSDREAVALLRRAWGPSDKRAMEQFEIIDIRAEVPLVKSWNAFIHTHHYDVTDDFFSSSLTRHPRRTGEDWMSRYWEAQWTTPNPPPLSGSFDDLHDWYGPLVDAELAEMGKTGSEKQGTRS